MVDPHKKQVVVPESADADALADRLRKLADGEAITYEALSKIVGRDVRNASCLETARRRLAGEGIHFSRKLPIGCVTRLSPTQKVDEVGNTLRSVGRKAKRGVQIGTSIEKGALSAMPNDKSASFIATMSCLRLNAYAADGRRTNKVAKAIGNDPDLPIGRLLKGTSKTDE